METRKHLADTVWSKPKYYAGFSPDGDYCVMSRHRESDCLSRSNWIVACEQFDAQPWDNSDDGFESRPAVYHWRAGHCMVGWVEYLMIRADAPSELLDRAEHMLAKLDGYPVLDERHFSDMEWNEANDYWESLPVKERMEYCKEAGVSIFAARHPWIPSDNSGYIYERLTAA